jgi:hypothetical protein
MRSVFTDTNGSDGILLKDRGDMLPSTTMTQTDLLKVHRALESLSPAQRAAICQEFGIEDVRPSGEKITVLPVSRNSLIDQSLRDLRKKPSA